eukprot:TRINITY_DN9114_c0_g1_i2.p1 TRINITY_DN9114_c0_g1~~TRINITY_DN9114_c0_g1_i2.p1  ORF type:complete len:225 (-),score=49.18 TRINITY_DN9114_c0_g1_i2:87-761(-)
MTQFERDEEIYFADVEVIVEDKTFKESAAAMALSSPVFSAMLRSSMQEGNMKTIRLEHKTKEDYAIFRTYFQPRAINEHALTVEDVDKLLPWFHEYQMGFMLQACEKVLLQEKATVKRLHQAFKYGLENQYERCTNEVAMNISSMELEDLPRDTEIMFTLLAAIQKADAVKQRRWNSLQRDADVAIERVALQLYRHLPSQIEKSSLNNEKCRDLVRGISAKLGI